MNVLLINCSPVRNGATAEIINTIFSFLTLRHSIKKICIDDYNIKLCRGCRKCHETAECVQADDVSDIIKELDNADIIIAVSPSYWADVPGQFKVFIDRCTPWCDTHEPHASIKTGKKGYTIALRTGPNIKECNRIIETIEHFYGHLKIKSVASMGLCNVKNKYDVKKRTDELEKFCLNI